MRITFLDPLDRVTGSSYLVHEPVNGVRFLVDCGAWQGDGPVSGDLAAFPFDPSSLDFVVLTHAHYDHCGRLPLLVRRGFRGPVHCTTETQQLARLTLLDSAGQPDAPFTKSDVDGIRWRPLSDDRTFNRVLPVAKDMFLKFYRTSHVLGAVSVQVISGDPRVRGLQRSVTFSGDLGPNREDVEVLPMLRHRMSPDRSDALIVESTYGDRARPPDVAARRSEQFEEVIGAARFRGGPVIVPCFALQRFQDVLLELHLLAWEKPELLRGTDVIVDARLALKMSKVFADRIGSTFTSSNNKERPIWLGKGLLRRLGLQPNDRDHERVALDLLREILVPGTVPDLALRERVAGDRFSGWRCHARVLTDREEVAGATRCVVLTSGGMCEGGPVRSWLEAHLQNPTATIVFPGYCAPGTLGGKLTRLGTPEPLSRRESEVPLDVGDLHLRLGDVRATVSVLAGWSGHADQRGLVDWVIPELRSGGHAPAAPLVFVTHGDPEARRGLEAALYERAGALGQPLRVELPVHPNPTFDLASGNWVLENGEVDRVAAMQAEIARLQAALARTAAK